MLSWSFRRVRWPPCRLSGERGKHDVPGNRGPRSSVRKPSNMPISSAYMQPTDHKSMAALYLSCNKINSGGRYQRVTTWPVKCRRAGTRAGAGLPASSPFCCSGLSKGKSSPPIARDRPKSQIFKEQSWLTRQFAGFRSRCMMPAECKYFTPINKLYSKVLICKGVKVTSVRQSFLRSESHISMTMYNSSKFAERSGASTS
mmetsp:Transcript_4841/g.9835  ORF Transcript_4841/g.9835 Transcript_4841/m.9835 type:complete len:201 (+) Transcript_4841:214-816(+)